MTCRPIAIATLCLVALTGAACATTPKIKAAEPATSERVSKGTLRVIGVLPQRLNPPHLVVGSEERVAWLNYTNRELLISLDPSALPALRCAEPGAFELEGTRLTTEQIGSAFFDWGCRLAPGEYAYRVERAPRDGEAPEVIYGSLVVVPQAALAR